MIRNWDKVINFSILFIIICLSLVMVFQVGKAADSDYKLTVGDRLYISVWGHSDLQQEAVVGPNGEINFPLVGEIKVKGLTVNELIKELTRQLQEHIKTKESKVNVVLKEYKKVKIMVLGEVKKPGVYRVVNDKKVIDLISLAGGATAGADLSKVRLTREDKSLSINLKALLEGKNQEENYSLQPGDTLYIPEKTIKVSVLGEVKQAGNYKVEKGTKLSDILARAGGVTSQASKKVRYISKKQKHILRLDKLFNGKDQNPTLQDGDTVYVLESKYNLKKLSFWKNVFFFVGGLNEIKDLLEINW